MSAAELSLIVVTVSFTALVIWVYAPRRRARLEAYGAMPLDDSDPADGGRP